MSSFPRALNVNEPLKSCRISATANHQDIFGKVTPWLLGSVLNSPHRNLLNALEAPRTSRAVRKLAPTDTEAGT